MIANELSHRAPARPNWVSLCSALTWMKLGRALELPELLAFAKTRGWVDDELRELLDAAWEELADHACGGSLGVRAKRRGGTREVQLTTDDLRNLRHVGWSDTTQALVLDRFPFTFSGGFQQNLSGENDGFDSPIVSRLDLATYKRVRARTQRSPADQGIYLVAERCLNDVLSEIKPQTGLRLPCIQALSGKFELPKYRSQEIWTKVLDNLRWPKRGRPANSEIKSLREFAAASILSWRAD